MAGSGHWLAFDVDDDLHRGLERFMDEFGVSREDAARVMLRDWAIGAGNPRLDDVDEETAGAG